MDFKLSAPNEEKEIRQAGSSFKPGKPVDYNRVITISCKSFNLVVFNLDKGRCGLTAKRLWV